MKKRIKRHSFTLPQICKVINFAVSRGITSKAIIASSMGMTPEEFEKKIIAIEKEYGIEAPERWKKSIPPAPIVNEKLANAIQQRISETVFDKILDRKVFITAIKIGASYEQIAKAFETTATNAQIFAEHLEENGQIQEIPESCTKRKKDRRDYEKIYDELTTCKNVFAGINQIEISSSDEENLDFSRIEDLF